MAHSQLSVICTCRSTLAVEERDGWASVLLVHTCLYSYLCEDTYWHSAFPSPLPYPKPSNSPLKGKASQNVLTPMVFKTNQCTNVRKFSSHSVPSRVRQNSPLCKHACTCSIHVFLWMTCVCLGVCVPPPSYCLPILSKRQKAHLDLVGWKVGRLHRALLVNWGLLPISRTTPHPHPSVLPLLGSPHVLPASKCPAQQIFETLRVNHKTNPPHSLLLYKQKEGVTRDGEPRSWHEWLLSEQAALTPEQPALIINYLPLSWERGSALYHAHSRDWTVSQPDSRTLHLPPDEGITWISLRST